MHLCAVEKAPEETDDQLFKDPLYETPEDVVRFVGKVGLVLLVAGIFEPRDFTDVNAVHDGDPCEHFESIELHKLEYFLV